MYIYMNTSISPHALLPNTGSWISSTALFSNAQENLDRSYRIKNPLGGTPDYLQGKNKNCKQVDQPDDPNGEVGL